MDSNNEMLGVQFLSFSLRDEHFAVEISKVREVLDVTTLTKIPRMPEYMCGVINLRGNVVPVTDLGLKLGMGSVEQTVNTCVMIVEVELESEAEKVAMGVVTDSVQEVLNLTPGEIEPVPQMGSNLNIEFIKGMGKKGEKFLILLDIAKILASEGETVLKDLQSISSLDMPMQDEASGDAVQGV